jgi:hypothetical protein
MNLAARRDYQSAGNCSDSAARLSPPNVGVLNADRGCRGIQDVAGHLAQAGMRFQPPGGADERCDLVPGGQSGLDDAPPERSGGTENNNVHHGLLSLPRIRRR